jgi:hypothetical protein
MSTENHIGRRGVMFGGAGLALAAGLGGCAGRAPPSRQFAEITFRQFAPLRFRAGRVDIATEYAAPQTAPNVDHQFPVTLSAMAERWGFDRLSAGGGELTARYVIVEASVIETSLPRTQGLRATFKIEQSERYDGRLITRLDLVTPRGAVEGTVTAQIDRVETIGENASIAERETLWFTMAEAMGRDLNAQMERQIRTHLLRYLMT